MRCVNLDKLELHLAILDGLIRKVLTVQVTEIDVLGLLSSSNDVISPLDACCVVFIDRGVWVLWEVNVFEEVAEVDYLDGHRRCCVIFCLCC